MLLILCNCGADEASSIARTLVEERLAACVNELSGVRSTYRWQGVVQVDQEATLLIKTTSSRVEELTARLRVLHSYDTPEILVLPVDDSLSDPRYLAWVRQMTEAE